VIWSLNSYLKTYLLQIAQQLSDKYGLSAAVARKRAGLSPLGPMRPGTSSGASSLGPMSLINEESGKDQVCKSRSVSYQAFCLNLFILKTWKHEYDGN
jgi:hypothetical protein